MMRVKPDIVKLDRDLIKRIHADPARMALVESFVRFARRIGATVCAEGIESLDDLEVVSDLDVQWGQGFALGRPAAALGARLAGRRRGLPGGAGGGAARRLGRAAEGSPPATAGSSTSAPGWPAPAPGRTSRAPWP